MQSNYPDLLPADYWPHLDAINRLIIDSGDKLEGNLFYHHEEPNPGRNNIVDYFDAKRRNYAAACGLAREMLEIGVNGGHSALLALSRGVTYHGVDICEHPYTPLVVRYLKDHFGERFHFYAGDSLKVVPQLAIDYPYLRFDLLHIDGLHTTEQCAHDTKNAAALALKNAWIIIDDTDLPGIKGFYAEQIRTGKLIKAAPEGWIANPHHEIARVA